MITKLTQLLDEAKRLPRRRLAVAGANDSHTIGAVARAVADGIVEATLYGDRKTILAVCKEENIDPSAFEIVESPTPKDAVADAVAAVSSGEAHLLMKGLVPTDVYMRGILNKEAGLFPPKGLLSHVTVVELPDYPRLVCACDVAIIPQPDFKQKTILTGYLAKVSRALGVERPKVAFIAPSEQVLPSVESSTDGAVLAKMAGRGQLGDIEADGPLSLDVALYPDVAAEKKVKGSTVAGEADCLLFPNLESGNVFFKSVTHFGGASIAAVVVGTNAPCVLTSRADTVETKLYSIALAAVLAAR